MRLFRHPKQIEMGRASSHRSTPVATLFCSARLKDVQRQRWKQTSQREVVQMNAAV